MSASVHGRGFDWWQASSMAFLARQWNQVAGHPQSAERRGNADFRQEFAQPGDQRRGGFCGASAREPLDLHGHGKIAQAFFGGWSG